MASDTPAVVLDRLTKYYGKHVGIEAINLSVNRGEVLGFLGPNGAGKTTAIRVLLGFLKPTAGRAEVLGHNATTDSVPAKRGIGYLPGDPALYGQRTGWDLLGVAQRARGFEPRPRAAIELGERLGASMDVPVKRCSRGMRQKVALVLALAHDPDVLILDEPTTGLDPIGQRAVLSVLNERGDQGRTVLFSSHNLPEVEQVADRVAILRNGRLVALDTIEALRGHKYKQVSVAYEGEPPSFEGMDDVQVVWRHEGRITVHARGDVKLLLSRLAAADVTDVTIAEPSLEEVFLDYYQGGQE